MSATDIPSHWQLSTANRWLRTAIGIVSILSAVLIDGLSDGWVFILVVLGMYTTQTAFFNIELLRTFFSLPEIDETLDNKDEVMTTQRSKIKQ